MTKDYVVNYYTGTFHDKKRATEKCNIDDIKNKKEMDIETLFNDLTGLVPCAHCWPRTYEKMV